MRKYYRWQIGLATLEILAWAGLDRIVKIALLRDWQADFSWFHIGLVKNFGLVFSWPVSAVLIFILLSIAILIVTVLLVRTMRTPSLATAGAGLMLVGALSNLIDRWRFGYVVDGFYLGPWWPVFNLADMAIALGLVLYLWPRAVDKSSSTA